LLRPEGRRIIGSITLLFISTTKKPERKLAPLTKRFKDTKEGTWTHPNSRTNRK
jgi:hypothetical protein